MNGANGTLGASKKNCGEHVLNILIYLPFRLLMLAVVNK